MTHTNIGKNINHFRKSKGYTQQQLGEILNVSTQSVSKWERESTSPDISLLPMIATTFGVSIDELFTQSLENDLTKIENMLDSKEHLTLIEEGYILEKLEHLSQSATTNRLKAKLFLNRGNTYYKSASKLIQNALKEDPNNKESHYIYLATNNGVMTDWNFYNKHEIIKYYKMFVNENPTVLIGYSKLLDHLIHDGRLDEARKILSQYKTLDDTFKSNWYQARINHFNSLIDPIVSSFNDDWLQCGIKADEYTKVGDYVNALKAYEKSYRLQPSPKYYDALECIAQIHEIRGEIDLSKSYYKKIVLNLKEEWNITFGSSINYFTERSL